MRRPPCGGRRMKRATCEPQRATATECVSDRIPKQLSLGSCSEMRAETLGCCGAARFAIHALHASTT
eukprot:1681041-Lingulodinium_polyedra.AAC.1